MAFGFKSISSVLRNIGSGSFLGRLDGGNPKSYEGKLRADIWRLFTGPKKAQRLDEDPIPFEYFFILGNNFYSRFTNESGVSSILKEVYEIEQKLEDYEQIADRWDDFIENHFNLGMVIAKGQKEGSIEELKSNFVQYLDTEQKRITVCDAYLFVRQGVVKYRKVIEKKFGKIRDSELNDYSMLFM